jgi:hypothetical protein
MADELPIPSSDAPATPEKPKTRINFSDDDLEAAGIADAKVGDSVTLTITGKIVSDNQYQDSRDKSIEVDSVESASPATPDFSLEPAVSPDGENAENDEEIETGDEGFPPVPPPEEDEEVNPDEEKALGYKRKKKKGPAAPPVNMKRMMGGF